MKRVIVAAIAAAFALSGISVVSPATAGEEEPAIGCSSKMNFIHKSTSAATAGRVKVYAETVCPFKADRLFTYVELERINTLFNDKWNSPLEALFKYNTARHGLSAVGDRCTPGYYKATSYHGGEHNGVPFSLPTQTREHYVNCT